MTARNAGLIATLCFLSCPCTFAQLRDDSLYEVDVTNPISAEAMVDSASITDTGPIASEQTGLIRRLQSEDVIERVARLGLPIMMEAESTPSAAMGAAEEPLVKSLTFQTSQLAAIRRWRGGGDSKSLPLDIGTQMDWDAETESYAFTQVRLELFDERLWIVRDWREDSDEEWNLGIQFKKTW